MEFKITGTPKEFADLIAQLQNRQGVKDMNDISEIGYPNSNGFVGGNAVSVTKGTG